MREGVKTIAQKLLDSAERGEPYSLKFYFDVREPLTHAQRDRLQAELKKAFELWRDTWLVPRVKQILSKYSTIKNGKGWHRKRNEARGVYTTWLKA